MRDPGVIALLLVCFCSQLSYAPYYNFFTLFVERHGHPSQLIGLLWSLAALAEIVMFFYAGRIIARWGARRVMIVAMAMTILRWSLTALCAEPLAVLVILPFVLAFIFAAYPAVAMRYFQGVFHGALQGRGRA